jgi:hypothetical protein
MKQKTDYSLVIVLINENLSGEIGFAKKWFAKSRFDLREANDIFQAMEEIDDFTTSHRPQVILLPIDLFSEDFSLLQETARCFSSNKRISFMALSGSHKIFNHRDCFEGTLSDLKIKLEEIIPKETSMGIVA